MNYKPVITGNQSNGNAEVQKHVMMQVKLEWRHYLENITLCYHCGLLIHHSLKVQRVLLMMDSNLQEMMKRSTNNVNAANTNEVNVVGRKASIKILGEPNMPGLEDIVYSDDDEDVRAEDDMNNLDAYMPVSPILTIKVHKYHPVEQIIRDLNSAPQT
ncbi:hypothetical protein Tco_0101558 [Tanacetum coccineum]